MWCVATLCYVTLCYLSLCCAIVCCGMTCTNIHIIPDRIMSYHTIHYISYHVLCITYHSPHTIHHIPYIIYHVSYIIYHTSCAIHQSYTILQTSHMVIGKPLNHMTYTISSYVTHATCTHLPSLVRVSNANPPWSWKPQRPVEVGSPKVIIRLKVSYNLIGHIVISHRIIPYHTIFH